MLYLTSEKEGTQEVLLEKGNGEVEMKSFSVGIMNEKWFDVAATGGAVQVSVELDGGSLAQGADESRATIYSGKSMANAGKRNLLVTFECCLSQQRPRRVRNRRKGIQLR